MTLPKKDLKRLAEIEKINRPFLKITGLGYEIEWLISSLRLAWAQNEVMKDLLKPCEISEECGQLCLTCADKYDVFLKMFYPALKRCEELKEDIALHEMAKEVENEPEKDFFEMMKDIEK